MRLNFYYFKNFFLYLIKIEKFAYNLESLTKLRRNILKINAIRFTKVSLWFFQRTILKKLKIKY